MFDCLFVCDHTLIVLNNEVVCFWYCLKAINNAMCILIISQIFHQWNKNC